MLKILKKDTKYQGQCVWHFIRVVQKADVYIKKTSMLESFRAPKPFYNNLFPLILKGA